MGFKNEMTNEELEQIAGGFPPELPATQLAASGYEGMFAPCEPIIPGGSLPATDITPPTPYEP